jgi:WD40 repeat protein
MIRVLLVALLVVLQEPKPRVDLAGDPLPEGAVSRLGTRRWRTPGRVWSLAFARDGRTLLVGAGTTLLAWDLEKNERRRAFQGHRGVVGSIALHPDGARVLTGDGVGAMGLWHIESGAKIRMFTGHVGRVWSVALSKDGATALSAGMDGTLGLWNVETGERTRTLKGHKGPAMGAVFIKDDTRILSGGADGRMILWDAATGDRLKSVDAHRGEISGVVLSPDGRTVVTTNGLIIPAEGQGQEVAEGSLGAWDVETGRRLRLIPGRAGFLWAAFTPDGKNVVAGCADRSAAVWDLETGARLLDFEGLGDRTHPVAIRDGVVAIGDGTSVALFDANTGKRKFDVPGHSDGVGGVGFLPDGRAVTAGADGWIGIWDPETGRRVRAIDTGALEFGALALSPDGKQALTGGWRSPVSLWNLESGDRIRQFAGFSARGLAFGPGTAVTALLDGKVLIWDLESGLGGRDFSGSSTGAVAVRPDGKRALVPVAPKSAAMIDFSTGQVLRKLSGHTGDVMSLAFSADGETAATGGADGVIILWDGEGEKEKGRIEAGNPVRALAFGPRGLLAAGHSGRVSVWETPSGKRLASYQGHNGGVTSVAIDREGRRVISGAGDTTAVVWEIPR